MSKKYISNHRLEEEIVNFLRNKADQNRINVEDFSSIRVLEDIQKKYDIDKKRIKKILNKLEKDGLIKTRQRYYDVYIPEGYENKFTKLTQKIDPVILPVIALLVGFMILGIIGSYSPLKIPVVNFNDPNMTYNIFLFGFSIPFLLGAVALLIAKTGWNFLYKNIKFLRDMVDFFGGVMVWVYAMFFSSIFIISYIVLCMSVDGYNVNPYHIVFILISTFLAVLLYSIKK